MSHRSIAVIALSLCALAAIGCGAKQTALPHAVYANSIPIYPGAVLKDAMGSTSMGDTPESMSDGMTWFLDVNAAGWVIGNPAAGAPRARRAGSIDPARSTSPTHARPEPSPSSCCR